MDGSSGKMKKNNILICYIIFTLLFTVPVILVLANTNLNSVKQIATSRYYLKVMGFTLLQAALSTILSLIAGLPGAFILARTDFRTKKLVKTIYSIPFVLPSIITVLAFVVFYGNNGLLNKALMKVFCLSTPPVKILYSFKAVIAAHVFYNAPLFATLLSDNIYQIDGHCLDAALSDGANNRTITKKILLPQIANGIYSSSCLVFLYCFTSFAIIMVLGGSMGMTTAEVEIYRLAKTSFDIPKAAALSIFSITSALCVLAIQSQLQKKAVIQQAEFVTAKLRKPSFAEKTYVVISVLLITLPLIAVFVRSFLGTATRTSKLVFSLQAYRTIDITCTLRTFATALTASVAGTVISLGLSIDIAKSKSVFKSTYCMLPMAVSSVILGLSYFILCSKLSFLSSFVLLIAAHTVLVIPFSVRTLLPAIENIPKVLVQQAMIEGTTQARYMFSIVLPLVKNSIVSSLVYGFAISCGELNSTLLIATGSFETLPIRINRLIGSYNYQGACANAVVLILFCFVLFNAANRSRDIKEHQTGNS